ncbi:MAG TPA: hypothetical protein VMB35_08205 [Methanomicrobiales archaeon]|nr:hypothetical protein [Methanomicrobiales archaeon]
MEQDALDELGLRRPGVAAACLIALIFVIPVLIGWAGGSPPHHVIGFVIAILLLQGLAPLTGIGMGLPVPHLLLASISVATGVILGVFMVCDIFAGRSERITKWMGKIQATMDKYRVLNRYGEYMLIPIMWVPGIGLYGTPVVAWVLHWRTHRSILLMLTGWLIACLTVTGLTEGVLALLPRP